MISNQILQSTIEELKAITRVDLCIIDLEGNKAAATFEAAQELVRAAEGFVDSPADSQEVGGCHFFKIYEDHQPTFILISRGSSDDAYMIGKVAVSEIQNLMVAYKERFDKNNFIQNLLLDNFLLVDIYNRAKRLHIELEARRVVFIIETKAEQDYMALETVKGLFASRSRDFITAVDERNIILVKELAADEGYDSLEHVGRMLVDMMNTEAMACARVSYGTIVEELKDVSRSYKEATMALDVGKIFYTERSVLGYNALGIGRLIYQLPIPLCEMFMNEVFTDEKPDDFDEETLVTVQKFFENNLNVSETARQLYIHRNTLVYRLEKLQKATGLDIRVFDDALTFQIGLMVANHMRFSADKNDF